MTLGFSSFGSSSSGNSYLIRSDTTCILVDVGLSASRICKGLASLGIETGQIDAVLLTHEHIDHVRSVQAFHKKAPQAVFYASSGTARALGEDARRLVRPLEGPVYPAFTVGDITVGCAALSHDAAEPVTYTFCKDGRKIAIVTDTGYIPEPLYQAVSDTDLLVLEANHEENILLYGRYPYPVKRRILSSVGHLSNEAAGRCLCRMMKERAGGADQGTARGKAREAADPEAADLEAADPESYGGGAPSLQVFLAHLSRENNTPEQAFLTVRNVLEEEDLYVGGGLSVDVLGPDGLPYLVEV